MQYGIHLPVKFVLPFEGSIEIIGHVRPPLGTEEQDVCHVPRYFFKRLTVSLKHRQKKKRQHHEYHEESCRTCSDMRFEKEKQRHTEKRTAAETDKLPFRKVEEKFCFDAG